MPRRHKKLPPPLYADLPEMVTPEEATAFLRLGRNQIYELVKANEIKHVKYGRLIRIPKTALVGEDDR